MKVIVATIGSFMYMTNEPGIHIVPERPVLVKADEFIKTLVMTKKATHLGGETLPDQATDAEWAKWFQDAGGWPNVDLAVNGFIDKWEGMDEESLAEQARETDARLAEEAREKAEADNRVAQQLLLDQAAAAKATEEAQKLEEQKIAAQAKVDAEAKEAAEKKAKEAAVKKDK